MLKSIPEMPLSEFDLAVFQAVVPQDHYLRKVMACINFETFRPRLIGSYDPDFGRPAIDPVRMLKILFLRFHYRLSDRQVMERTVTDMAFRWFLGLSVYADIPNHTNGTHFRQRIGVESFQQVFQDLITQAREHGLVRDRLRLKDATHLFADVAKVGPLPLVAQVREHLLQAAEPLFAEWVRQERALYATLRQTTAELPDDERLAHRVEHLRGLATTLQQQLTDMATSSETACNHVLRLQRALAVAFKLLTDRDNPEAGDRLASVHDPDARHGKHGQFYVGYLVDVAMDADSEIITAVNVLPANGAEAADAATLIHQEEEAQGNDVQGLSMDGAGYNGPVLHELTNPQGLNLDMTVPPPPVPKRTTFGPERFTLTVLDDGSRVLTCPAGQTSRPRQHNTHPTATQFTFKAESCAACPLREQCFPNPARKTGRTVVKNDYQAEYDKVQAKAKTTEYEQTRRVHPKIERKLNELARHHGCRRACYRGKPKVLVQSVLTALVVNIKRIVNLLARSAPWPMPTVAVRAEPAGS